MTIRNNRSTQNNLNTPITPTKNNMKNFKLYIAITYGLIWAVGCVLWLSGADYPSLMGNTLVSICMFFPLVATLICQASSRQPPLRGIGISWKVNRWWFLGWLTIPAIVLLTLLFNYWIDGNHFTTHSQSLQLLCNNMHLTPVAALTVTFLFGMLAGATINALFAFGEEIGWRGYLLTLFRGRPFFIAAIVTGLVWGLWHAPFILMGHNYPQHPNLVGILAMIIVSIPLSVLFQYFRLKSGSVIVPAIMHGTINALSSMTNLFMYDYNDLLIGIPGLAGFLALLVVVSILFLYDRYISHERLFTSHINL